MKSIDRKDLRILHELDLNCRLSNAQIAKRVGVSKEVVQFRIKRLEKHGVIKFYYPVIDNARLGYTNYRVYFTYQETTPELEEEMFAHFRSQKRVTLLIKLTQPFNLGIMISTKEPLACEAILDGFLARYGKHVSSMQFSVFTEVEHYPKRHLLGEQDETRWCWGGEKATVEMTTTDLAILKLLGHNARMPHTALALQLKLNVKTLQYRIKRLERLGVIQCYRAMIDLQLLKKRYYKIDVKLLERSERQKLLAFARETLSTVYVDRVLGGWDFEFEVEVQDREELLALIGQVKRLAKVEAVRYYEFEEMYEELSYIAEREK